MFSRKYVGLLLVILLAATAALGQGVNGKIIGTVTDSTGAIIVGAKVDLVDQATQAKRSTTSGADGKFIFLAVQNGLYKVTVTMQGFQTAVYNDIKVDLGATAEIVAKMTVGQVQSEVVVEAAAEVLQTQSTAIEGGVQGRQLRGLPMVNRDVLDFVLLMPGAQQTGVTRNSTFEGLPKGALNITLDGMNVQDNAGKSSSNGGYFTSIRPKQDAIEEIAVTTGNNTADAAGSGAVQIKFVTRRGTNDWHGGLFEFYRDQGLNSNLFFNKRTTGTVAPRPLNHLNQYGGSIGGPLIKNKLFIFNNFEDFRMPQAFTRTSSILKPAAILGTFDYGAGSKNVLDIARAAGLPATADPTIAAQLGLIDTVRNVGGVVVEDGGAPWYDSVRWNMPTGARRFFNTTRLDYDVNDRFRWNLVGQWNHFASAPFDVLNNADPPFPIAAVQHLGGAQNGERYLVSTALNWTISPRMNYEVRLGRTSSISHFNDGLTIPGMFPDGYGYSFDTLGLPNLFGSPGATGYQGLPDNRDTPVISNSHNFGLVTGKHTMNFGAQIDYIKYWETYYNYFPVPTIGIGFDSDYDPAVLAAFSNCAVGGTCALPGATSEEAFDAAALWSTLVGRVSGVGLGRNLDEKTHTYQDGVAFTDVLKQTVFGFYFQDSYRATKSLTVNLGVRWEQQGAAWNPNNTYTWTGYDGLFGVSGRNNLFNPGVMNGSPSMYNPQNKGFYNSPRMFTPSFGLAWSPTIDNKLWRAFFGAPGKTVFRGGYSIATVREGLYVQETALQNVPNFGQQASLTAGIDFLNDAAEGAAAGPLMLRDYIANGNTWPVPYSVFPPAYEFPMPASLFAFQGWSLHAANPNIKMPYVQSWSFGFQRELSPNMVLEARYQGNHGTRLWRSFNINEVNIFENTFLDEFKLAQNNQKICTANATICRAAQTAAGIASPSANSFANWSAYYVPAEGAANPLAGQKALPILQTAFGGVTNTAAANYWNSSGWYNLVLQGRAGNMASNIANSSSTLCRMVGNSVGGCADLGYGAGSYPANFWFANPDAAGTSAWLLDNAGDSNYNAFMLELRRRMSHGLMIQGNYTWSKSLSTVYADSTVDQSSFITLRNTRLNRGPSPFDLTHTARVFWTWELPFGPGRRFTIGNKMLSKVAEGWEFTGIAALQTGRVFKLTSGRGTVNGSDAGVVLNGITAGQLESLIGVNKDVSTYSNCPTGHSLSSVYYMPAFMLDPTNCTAFHYQTDGPIIVPSTPGVWGQMVYLHGPHFIKPDLTVAKQTKITERVNARFEARFFNAFNMTNFLVGAANGAAITNGLSSSSFGRTSAYYQDQSGNQDPGSRMIEVVLRLNF